MNTSRSHERLTLKMMSDLASNQKKRQLALLERQKQQRKRLQEESRNEPSPLQQLDELNSREPILMHEEYMLETPTDLENWICVPRPDGKRCLLIVKSNGYATSKVGNQPNKILHKFQGRFYKANQGEKTILDAIYCAGNNTYYILDVLQWKSYDLMHCTAEFRFYWLQNNFEPVTKCEFNVILAKRLPAQQFFALTNGSCAATNTFYDHSLFSQDGLYVYNKESDYTIGSTPLLLYWKDLTCCSYLRQQLSSPLLFHLRYIPEQNKLVTCDGTAIPAPPLNIGPVETLAKVRIVFDMTKAEDISRCITIVSAEQDHQHAFADSISKLVFYYRLITTLK